MFHCPYSTRMGLRGAITCPGAPLGCHGGGWGPWRGGSTLGELAGGQGACFAPGGYAGIRLVRGCGANRAGDIAIKRGRTFLLQQAFLDAFILETVPLSPHPSNLPEPP